MVNIICLFFPTFISIYILNNKKRRNRSELLIIYPIYNIFVNLISFIVSSLYIKDQINIVTSFNNLNFVIKYLLLSCFWALLMPSILEFLKKNISVSSLIKKDSKKS